MAWTSRAIVAVVFLFSLTNQCLAWGGFGHRTVAAIAMRLIPQKAAELNQLLAVLEKDNNFVDAASYPDEWIRDHDPGHQFNSWHFADLPDDGSTFVCAGKCLFDALDLNTKALGGNGSRKDKAVAVAWIVHLIGDLHQPLHMSGRDRGGNEFPVTYRGKARCKNYSGLDDVRMELHSAWDDCLVEELANGRTPDQLAGALLGTTMDYHQRPEAQGDVNSWAQESHALANSVAFDHLKHGDDLGNSYIDGSGKALATVQRQLLAAGIRLARYLDENYKSVNAR